MSDKLSILLIGAGSMGGAMLKGWIDSGLLDATRSAVLMPNLKSDISAICAPAGVAINPCGNHEHGDQFYDLVVLAVKPQKFADVLPKIQFPEMHKSVFISVAAGKTIDDIETILKTNQNIDAQASLKIIRVMPNLPVAVGRGMSIALAGKHCDDDDIRQADQSITASGKSVWVQDEDQFDKAMAISGCGPAYVFLLSALMTKTAMGLGFDSYTAEKLAQETVIGAGLYMAADNHRTADEMKRAVMSPGGTTEQAVFRLEEPDALPKILDEAIHAAIKRAKEM